MSEFAVKIPPDSTGKAIRHEVQIEVDYINKTGEFPVGDVVIFTTSGVTGTILLDHAGIQHTEEHLHVKLTHGSPSTIVQGENMIVNGEVIAQAGTTTVPFYIPSTIAVGGNNPTNLQHIDSFGASKVAFEGGTPFFDSFGNMGLAVPTTIGEYTFNYDGRDVHFTDITPTGTSVVHDQTVGCMVITNNTTSGNLASRRSDMHHRYIPGNGHIGEMTVASSAGQPNLTRRWGLFTNTDGVFFELVDNLLSVVVRSSVSGTVVENRIEQSIWNGDRLDGSSGLTNLSTFTIDTTKDNIYWMDYQWLGAGTVRFGVFIDGNRIVVHEVHNANVQSISYMRTGSLPIAFEQETTGTTGSTSEMRWFCGTVKSFGRFEPHMGHFDYNSGSLSSVPADVFTPMLTIRPSLIFKSLANKIIIIPEHISLVSLDATNTTDVPILIEIWKNPTVLVEGSYNVVHSLSGAELADDTTYTYGTGLRIGSMINTGTDAKSISEFFDFLHENLVNKQDGTYNRYVIFVKPLIPSTTANIMASLTWKEVRD